MQLSHRHAPCGTTRQLASSRSRPMVRASASSARSGVPLRIPNDVNSQVSQAVQAIEAAWRAGVKRQRVELLLPLIGATDIDDWPGGIRQQFKAISPMVEAILKQLKQIDGLQGPLAAEIWDQGDAVGAWYGTRLAAVVFPNATTLPRIQQLADTSPAPDLILMFNPQQLRDWEIQGTWISELGFGDKKEQSLSFVNSFEYTYYLRQQRINGDDVRVLSGYPGGWQIHVVGRDGAAKLLDTQDQLPSYQEVEKVLKAWPESNSNKSWVDRLKSELKFNQDSLKGPN